MVPDTLLSCTEPPSIELFSVSPQHFQLLSVSNPTIIKRELFDRYGYLSNHLFRLFESARHIADYLTEDEGRPSDYEFVQEVET